MEYIGYNFKTDWTTRGFDLLILREQEDIFPDQGFYFFAIIKIH